MRIYTANRNQTRNDVFVNGTKLDIVPSQNVYNHSPTGFEWGYGGSGPSQLALAILLDLFGREIALQHYQQFKWDFIAPAREDGFAITSLEIEAWLEKQQKS